MLQKKRWFKAVIYMMLTIMVLSSLLLTAGLFLNS
ncbi:stressosome-associated protein Prli42 [Paenibacillus pectinilyticus]|nr:stressosome-associated protein Prli42 [Paenibacillus pectinilyticus]